MATLTPDQDFTEAINGHEKRWAELSPRRCTLTRLTQNTHRRRELAQEIHEESQEISAEIADLSAAEE